MQERTPIRLLEPLCALIATVAVAALIAFPTLGSPQSNGSDAELDDCLALLRTAVWHYGLEHRDADGHRYPAQDGSAVTLLAQLTGRTDELGMTDDGLTTVPLLYGPYLRTIPTNPSNGRATIRIGRSRNAEIPGKTGTAGWVYLPETGEIRAD